MRLASRLTFLAAAAAALAACSSTPTATAPAPVSTAQPATAAPAAGASTAAQPESKVTTVELPPYLDSKNPLATERSVYFDFDNFSIKHDYDTMLARHGDYLAKHPNVAIKVEGNADERGSPEYNLALGQKRALAVVSALKVFGVRDAQMEAVSWGEEKPKATGHDEAAWAQNRRADLQYPSR